MIRWLGIGPSLKTRAGARVSTRVQDRPTGCLIPIRETGRWSRSPQANILLRFKRRQAGRGVEGGDQMAGDRSFSQNPGGCSGVYQGGG